MPPNRSSQNNYSNQNIPSWMSRSYQNPNSFSYPVYANQNHPQDYYGDWDPDEYYADNGEDEDDSSGGEDVDNSSDDEDDDEDEDWFDEFYYDPDRREEYTKDQLDLLAENCYDGSCCKDCDFDGHLIRARYPEGPPSRY